MNWALLAYFLAVFALMGLVFGALVFEVVAR